VRTHSPNEATDEPDLVAPVGPTYPPRFGRWRLTPTRCRGNAGVVGRISPLAAPREAGAGHTIIEGGTGGSQPVPVTTLAAFRVTGSGGDFECQALAPPRPTGPGSGAFTSNVMYVAGTVTSLPVRGRSAVFQGTAAVTGLRAGHHHPFPMPVTASGPGAPVLLSVSGLTFHEIRTDGHIDVN
jgi:hypothetical protein